MDPYQPPQQLGQSAQGLSVASATSAPAKMIGPSPAAANISAAHGPHGQGRHLKVRQDVKEASRPAGPVRVSQASPKVAREEMKEVKRAELWARFLQEKQSAPQAAVGITSPSSSMNKDNLRPMRLASFLESIQSSATA